MTKISCSQDLDRPQIFQQNQPATRFYQHYHPHMPNRTSNNKPNSKTNTDDMHCVYAEKIKRLKNGHSQLQWASRW